MNASFGYDVSKLNDSKNVLVLSAETGQLGKDVLLTPVEKNNLNKLNQAFNEKNKNPVFCICLHFIFKCL